MAHVRGFGIHGRSAYVVPAEWQPKVATNDPKNGEALIRNQAGDESSSGWTRMSAYVRQCEAHGGAARYVVSVVRMITRPL
jgi:hypothetical protein